MDSQRRIIKDGCIAIQGDRILDIGKTEEVKKRNNCDVRIDAKGKLILPGLIDCHQHTTQMLARGLADDVDLNAWLYDRILPFEAAMNAEDILTSALLCCVEMIRNGTTCFADPGGYHMEMVSEAIAKTGMRGVISYGAFDADASEKSKKEIRGKISASAEESVRKTEELYRRCNGFAHGRVRVSASLRSDTMVSEELALKIDELARRLNTIVQMHSANTKERVKEFEAKHHAGVFEFFDSLGVLGPHWLLGHVAFLTTEQASILAKRGVNICHAPGSSLHGAYGSSVYGKFPELLALGANVCLGCDASAANNSLDMFLAMRQAATIHKEARASAAFITPEQSLEMATINGALALNMGNEIGSIEKGKMADLVVVGLGKANSTPMHDFSIVPNLIYSVTGADVESVWINGKKIMEDRKVLTMDEDGIVEEAQRAGELIYERAGLQLNSRWPVFA